MLREANILQLFHSEGRQQLCHLLKTSGQHEMASGNQVHVEESKSPSALVWANIPRDKECQFHEMKQVVLLLVSVPCWGHLHGRSQPLNLIGALFVFTGGGADCSRTHVETCWMKPACCPVRGALSHSLHFICSGQNSLCAELMCACASVRVRMRKNSSSTWLRDAPRSCSPYSNEVGWGVAQFSFLMHVLRHCLSSFRWKLRLFAFQLITKLKAHFRHFGWNVDELLCTFNRLRSIRSPFSESLLKNFGGRYSRSKQG